MSKSILRRGCAALLLLIAGACTSRPPDDDVPPPTASEPSAPASPSGLSASSSAGTVLGKAPIAAGLPSVVVLHPEGQKEFPPQDDVPFMDQVALTFIPGTLLVRTGEPSEFRNSDEVLHNVRVAEVSTNDPQFNVAIPTGETYRFTFPREGFYDVGCDIHPAMTGLIFASSTPYYTLSDATGSFSLTNVPPGSYMAVAYVGGQKVEQPVTVGAGETVVTFEARS